MNLNRYSKIIVALSLIIAFFVPISASAAYKVESIDVANIQYQDFVVGPGKIEIEIAAGESKTTAITVSNRTGGKRVFHLEVEDFTGSRNPNEAIVLLGDDRGPYSLKDFLKFESSTFELENGQKATIPVTVNVPTDVDPGGHYGSVLVSTTEREATSPQSAAIVSRLGVLFFVKVPGPVNEEGRLSGFSTVEGQKFYGSGPIGMRLLYENNGSVYVNPYGEIRIKNILGQEVGFVEVDPWFSLPQSVRLREISWNRPFLFGRYTAVASINRGYGDIVDTMQISFWVIPWKIALGVLATVFVLILALRFVVTRFEIKKK